MLHRLIISSSSWVLTTCLTRVQRLFKLWMFGEMGVKQRSNHNSECNNSLCDIAEEVRAVLIHTILWHYWVLLTTKPLNTVFWILILQLQWFVLATYFLLFQVLLQHTDQQLLFRVQIWLLRFESIGIQSLQDRLQVSKHIDELCQIDQLQ